ncbi:MAG: NADH-quinone oxidoreductase subunit L [Clostridia bacterium]|nr:NADH-quinone oxidoreductase subunit L [Clostridia bacterium]
MIQNAWLIPLLPVVAFILIIFMFRPYRLLSALTAVISMFGSLVISIGVLYQTVTDPSISMSSPVEIAVPWLEVPGLTLEMGLLIDPLTGVMLFVVTFIAFLVMVYSMGYMSHDPGYSRFFAYLSLFTFSMLGLVVANNFFQMFVFWELVGLCSYLLIGFWFHKNSASEANKKAFITNRVADFGFLIGILMIFFHFGTFNFIELGVAVQGFANIGLLTIIALLIFVGPMGKSGQFPLHVWLPDAMEGPTPVSALIHAATMVAAGVYLLARSFSIFYAAPESLVVIAYIGGFTAFFAATIAITQNDFKRILAFSTLSQLGYMVMAIGVGSISAAMFHLTTHAFFKALLFLGAGSVIHALHEKQNIWEMGGLSKKMPITTWTFVIGSLALAGVFPLAGFWSKDEILVATKYAAFGGTGLWWLATITAFLTAFYMFRLIFVAFFSPAKPENHPHESPVSMALPLIILGFLSIFAGFIGSPLVENGFSNWIYFGEPHAPIFKWSLAVKSTAVAFAGMTLAWLIYHKQVVSAEAIKNRLKPIYTLLYNKYYIDELYQLFFDKVVYNIGNLFNWGDKNIIDGIADGKAALIKAIGEKVRLIQTGNMQNYAFVIFTAIAIFVLLTTGFGLGGAQ